MSVSKTRQRLVDVARQLFAVLEDEPSLSFFLDYARLIERRYSEMDIKVFKVVAISEEDGLVIEDSLDYLHDPSSNSKTRLQLIGDFTIA